MIRIGILSPSEIAKRRFLPALTQLKEFKFVGLAYANQEEWTGSNEEIIEKEREKSRSIVESYGAKLFDSYVKLIKSDEIDAVYIPLPPALHYYWAKEALLAGKHVLVEKPATISSSQTQELIHIAKTKKLALHENYMFIYHEQIKTINEIVESGKIGDLRLLRLTFGFPRREANDFRYNKNLGGGALLDCGGYPLRYASELLGATTKLVYANSNYIKDFEVDIFGSAVLVNEDNKTAQIAFGMDNSYKCDVEIWGSKGSIFTGRIFTAPTGFVPEATLKIGNEEKTIKLPSDDTFKKSIQTFYQCIEDEDTREINYSKIIQQAKLIQSFMDKANI